MDRETFHNKIFDGITQAMNRRDLDNMAAELWMEDAGIDESQARMLLDMIFTAKAIAADALLIKEFPDQYGDCGPLEAQHRFIERECISEDYTWEQAVEECISSALTYYCMDNWQQYYDIIQILNQDHPELEWFNKELYGKAVSYLYDGYACDWDEEDELTEEAV